jgi:glutamate decarboxylase
VVEKGDELPPRKRGHASTYSSRYFAAPIPKYEIPEEGMPANAAYQLIHDEMNMDANPALNLASFVTTWMEPEAAGLFQLTPCPLMPTKWPS